MYDPEMRKDCPMRGIIGNCSPVGGFCMDAVSDEICKAVHNAYQQGYVHALIRIKELKELKEQKPKPDCKTAERNPNSGKCCGYGRGEYDDEPIDECQNCPQYDSYEIE